MKNVKPIIIAVVAVLVVVAVVFLFGAVRNAQRDHKVAKGEEKLINTFYEEYNNRNFTYIYHVMFGANFRENTPYAEFEAVQKAIYNKTGKAIKWESSERETKEEKGTALIYSRYKALREKQNTVDEFALMEKKGVWAIENMRQSVEKQQ